MKAGSIANSTRWSGRHLGLSRLNVVVALLVETLEERGTSLRRIQGLFGGTLVVGLDFLAPDS